MIGLLRIALLTLSPLCLCAILQAEGTPVAIPDTFPPHPRLFTNDTELCALKAFISSSSSTNDFVHQFLQKCESRLSDPPHPPKTIVNVENRTISLYARDMAIAYILTDRLDFARASATILRQYANLYPDYAVSATKGKAMPSTLNEARWAIDLATAYDLIYNSGALSDSDKRHIESNVFIPCGNVLRICNHKTRSNWRARAIAGLGVIGFCIGNREFIEEAINGFHSASGQVARNGFVHHLQYSILGDGIFYERSFGYQAFTTDSYFLLMEAARHSHVDLWNLVVEKSERDAGSDIRRHFGPAGPKTIKPLFDALFYRTFSDGAVTNVANATADHFLPRRYYEAAWRAWRDPKFAYAARLSASETHPWRESPQFKETRISDPADLLWLEPTLPLGHFSLSPDATIGNSGIHKNGCTLFPNGGYAILRDSISPSAVCAEMNFGHWGSGHSHPDKLSIVVSDGNKKVVREVKYFGYADERYLTWDRQTIAHNTITVDETSQHPQADSDDPWPVPPPGTTVHGRPLLFYPGQRLKAFRAECEDAYPGIRLTRTIAIVESIVFDFYKAESSAAHQFDYALHIDSPIKVDASHFKSMVLDSLSPKYGYRHLSMSQLGKSPFEASLGDNRDIHFFSPGEAYIGTGIASKDHEGRGVVILRQDGPTAIFVTAFAFKPHNSSLTLSQSGLQKQTVMIGKHLQLINQENGIELRTASGELIERSPANALQ